MDHGRRLDRREPDHVGYLHLIEGAERAASYIGSPHAKLSGSVDVFTRFHAAGRDTSFTRLLFTVSMFYAPERTERTERTGDELVIMMH